MCSSVHQNSSKTINGLIFKTNCSSIEQRFKKLGDGLLSKIGKNKHKFPIFDNDFLSSSNQIKLKSTDLIFPIKQDDICDYNPLCFMSSGMMLDNIIMDIFTQSTKNTTKANQEHFFSDPRMMQFNCTKDICRTSHGKPQLLIQKGHCVLIITFILKYARIV